jgi:hypothetical protein
MARTVTLGTLVSRCQARADKEGDSHVPSTEWKALISEIYGQLHSLVTECGARCFESEQTVVANGAANYALNSDHLSTVGVDFVLDAAGRRRPLTKAEQAERTFYIGQTGEAYVYEVIGTNLVLYPKPSSGSYIHTYTPQPTDLSAAADGTSVDVLTIDGESFLVWGASSIAKHKSDDDQRRAMLEFDKARERLVVWAFNRAAQFSPRRQIVAEDIEIADPSDWMWR